MSDELAEIKQEIAGLQIVAQQIHERNQRVEIEKDWEQSFARRGLIASLTYLFSSTLLWVLAIDRFYLSALVPTFGYLLSTLSIPVVKRRWIERARQERKLN